MKKLQSSRSSNAARFLLLVLAATAGLHAERKGCVAYGGPLNWDVTRPNDGKVTIAVPPLPPPVSFAKDAGQYEKNLELFVVPEQTGFVLPTILSVDAVASTGQSGFISAGEAVDVFLVHFDPATHGRQFDVEITFSGTILGLIFNTESLLATDGLLGLPDVTYETVDVKRGIDDDEELVEADVKTLRLKLAVTVHLDELRVVTTVGCPTLLGDVNCDGRVDLADLNAIRNNFGTDSQADADGNGRVNLADLNLVRNNFGAGRPVPEPWSLVLLFISAATIAIHRSRSQRV